MTDDGNTVSLLRTVGGLVDGMSPETPALWRKSSVGETKGYFSNGVNNTKEVLALLNKNSPEEESILKM